MGGGNSLPLVLPLIVEPLQLAERDVANDEQPDEVCCDDNAIGYRDSVDQPEDRANCCHPESTQREVFDSPCAPDVQCLWKHCKRRKCRCDVTEEVNIHGSAETVELHYNAALLQAAIIVS